MLLAELTDRSTQYTAMASLGVAALTLVGVIVTAWLSRGTRKEVRPNGGSTIKDQVTAIAGEVRGIKESFRVHAHTTEGRLSSIETVLMGGRRPPHPPDPEPPQE